ncbi:hypothetical protein IGX79_002369, partial [Escherichia coli]|nr:hypothetical protein [Escherichia coli]HCE0293302.1 hypothetical protein [Escherichia coli]
MKKIPCVMMRGGTSRGAFLLAEHLPEDQTQRDKILMAIMGSGNDLEIDGIGGNDSNLLIVFYVQIMPDDFV